MSSQMVGVFASQWGSGFMHQAQGLFKMALAALLIFPEANFLHVEKLLQELSFREKVIRNIRDPLVKRFCDRT